ncbi:hypothetical protein GGR56DRAFT_668589 [Xylariaceae sp. FL0804]|nr:hypothetical protein GGR56DRAFT_668589 [Xylariaceae sp. FL0804]
MAGSGPPGPPGMPGPFGLPGQADNDTMRDILCDFFGRPMSTDSVLETVDYVAHNVLDYDRDDEDSDGSDFPIPNSAGDEQDSNNTGVAENNDVATETNGEDPQEEGSIPPIPLPWKDPEVPPLHIFSTAEPPRLFGPWHAPIYYSNGIRVRNWPKPEDRYPPVTTRPDGKKETVADTGEKNVADTGKMTQVIDYQNAGASASTQGNDQDATTTSTTRAYEQNIGAASTSAQTHVQDAIARAYAHAVDVPSGTHGHGQQAGNSPSIAFGGQNANTSTTALASDMNNAASRIMNERGRRLPRRYQLTDEPSNTNNQEPATMVPQPAVRDVNRVTAMTDFMGEAREPTPAQSQGSTSVTRRAPPPQPLDLGPTLAYTQRENRHRNVEVVHNPVGAAHRPEVTVQNPTMHARESLVPEQYYIYNGFAYPTSYFYSPSVYNDAYRHPSVASSFVPMPPVAPQPQGQQQLQEPSQPQTQEPAQQPTEESSQQQLRVPRPAELRDVHFLARYTNSQEEATPGGLSVPRRREHGHATMHHVRSRSALGLRSPSAAEMEDAVIAANSDRRASAFPDTYAGQLGQAPGQVQAQTTQRAPGLVKSHTAGNLSAAIRQDSSPFSPLTPYIPFDAPGAGSKKLFGSGGWLEDTAAQGLNAPKANGKAKTEGQKTGMLENIKRKAREIAEAAPFRQPTRGPTTTPHLVVSLDAREQSLMYCELEFNLSNGLDAYIRSQLDGGRLAADRLARVAEQWAARGRPRVIGFRWDLDTQLGLIAAHIDDFRFYALPQNITGAETGGGRWAKEHQILQQRTAIREILQGARANARQMAVRTFCQPDPVIAKHVGDAQVLARLLGCPDGVQRALEEVAQFFRVVVERQRTARARREEEQRLRFGMAVDEHGNSQRQLSQPQQHGIGQGTMDNGHINNKRTSDGKKKEGVNNNGTHTHTHKKSQSQGGDDRVRAATGLLSIDTTRRGRASVTDDDDNNQQHQRGSTSQSGSVRRHAADDEGEQHERRSASRPGRGAL